jgi:hypothetical protein
MRPERLYYFRGTTLQTDQIPIIQYLACDQQGRLHEKVEIYHDGRCDYTAASEGELPVAPIGISEAEARWGYGTAAKCSFEEFEAMKQLALKLVSQGNALDANTRKKLKNSVF